MIGRLTARKKCAIRDFVARLAKGGNSGDGRQALLAA
jgi:hypothetical protein